MILSGQLHELGAVDVLSHVAAMTNGHHTVLGSMQDERRGSDHVQDRANVTVICHTQEGHRGARAYRLTLVSCPPLSHPWIIRVASRNRTEHHAGSPLLVDPIEQLVLHIGRGAPGIVRSRRLARIACVKNERRCSLWVGGGKQEVHRATL